jgi:signal transduction histidine kinase
MRSALQPERRVHMHATPLPPPPWDALRVRLLEHADALARAGDDASASSIRTIVEAWWSEQQAWNVSAARVLAVHHDINNALVGVSGNAQLLQLGPAGHAPGVRERLDVVIREAQRIRDAALELPRLRAALRESIARGEAAGGER